MKLLLPTTLLTALTLMSAVSAEKKSPDPVEVTNAMRKASDFYQRHLASHGGYASAWKQDLSLGYVEHRESKTVISIQPPGTGTVGLSMLQAWEATGDETFYKGARDAAQALIDCQLESGCWSSDFDFESDDPETWWLRKAVLAGDVSGKRKDGKPKKNKSTLDDNKSQSSLLLLLELAHTPRGADDRELQEALAYAFDHLLAAQHPIGSWPQQFEQASDPNGIVKKAVIPSDWSREWPRIPFSHYHTLNDHNLLKVVEVLLRAHELTGEARYLDSARRVGDFLLLAQFEGDQAGWAQQYNEEMVPSWARKFEPPALTSTESFSAMEILYQIWLATGEEKYRDAIYPALDWLERSRLPSGEWSRFYEFRTNKPLYFVAETYELTYDDSNLPTHYGFKTPASLANGIEKMRENLKKTREELIETTPVATTPEEWAKVARKMRNNVNRALSSATPDGIWIAKDLIDARLFSRNLDVLSAYAKASRLANPEP